MPPKRKPAAQKKATSATSSSSSKRRKTESDENAEVAGAGDEEQQQQQENQSENNPMGTVDKSQVRAAPNGAACNMKIASWNVAGIRAVLKKAVLLEYLRAEDADIVCLQETKCARKDLPGELANLKQYPFKYYHDSTKTAGYAGVALLSKRKPLSVEYGLSVAEYDVEGRMITATYEDFILVNAYIPNAGRGLVRLDYRMRWDEDLRRHLNQLEANSGGKPVILTGDLNVAHAEIDLANPKTNTKTAGFTPEERASFSKTLEGGGGGGGFIDSFRFLYPELKHQYTFWSYMRASRSKNVGWRLDYFVLSRRLADALCDSQIRSQVMGSDHCPVVLYLALPSSLVPVQQ